MKSERGLVGDDLVGCLTKTGGGDDGPQSQQTQKKGTICWINVTYRTSEWREGSFYLQQGSWSPGIWRTVSPGRPQLEGPTTSSWTSHWRQFFAGDPGLGGLRCIVKTNYWYIFSADNLFELLHTHFKDIVETHALFLWPLNWRKKLLLIKKNL